MNGTSWNGRILVLSTIAALAAAGIIVTAVRDGSERAADTDAVASNTTEPTVDEMTEQQVMSYDKEIKNAMASAAGIASEYVNNHNGATPSTPEAISEMNMALKSTKMRHPISKQPYVLVQTEPKDNEMLLLTGKKCASDVSYVDAASRRSIIIQAMLVSGSLHCIDV